MTLNELYTKAQQEAGILAAGEDASAEDVQFISNKYAALYDMLLTEGLVAWTATEDIPLYAEVPMTYLLASFIAPGFNVPSGKQQELMLMGGLNLPQPSIAERMLRRQLSKNYVSSPATPDYF